MKKTTSQTQTHAHSLSTLAIIVAVLGIIIAVALAYYYPEARYDANFTKISYVFNLALFAEIAIPSVLVSAVLLGLSHISNEIDETKDAIVKAMQDKQ